MKHKDKIIRWANCPDETKVWFKVGDFEWGLTMYPNWEADVKYVVDDEYATVRKFFVDNKYIYFKNDRITSPGWEYPVENYSTTTKEPEWYEKEENIGKLIYIRDNDAQKWVVRTFKKYHIGNTSKFETEANVTWRQAMPIDVENLAK